MTKSTGVGRGSRKRTFPVLPDAFRTLTYDSLYWAGFIMADGCVQEGGRVTVVSQSADRPHLEEFREFMGAFRHRIHERRIGTCSLAFMSRPVADSLFELGITPRKSLTAVPNARLCASPEFWRGVADGDGTVGIYRDRQRHRPTFYLCGSHGVMGGFAGFVGASLGWTPNLSRKQNIWTSAVHGGRAVQVIRLLWNGHGPALERKAVIVSAIIRDYGHMTPRPPGTPCGGVYQHKNRNLRKPWSVRIWCPERGAMISAGYFATESEALAASAAAREKNLP